MSGGVANPGQLVADARYIYSVPSGTADDNLIRFDKTKPFTSPSSWEVFHTKTIDSIASGMEGPGAFDGSYIYLPDFNDGNPSKFLRIDGVSKSP